MCLWDLSTLKKEVIKYPKKYVNKYVACLMLMNSKKKTKADGEGRMMHKERAPVLGREGSENPSEKVRLTMFPLLCHCHWEHETVPRPARWL